MSRRAVCCVASRFHDSGSDGPELKASLQSLPCFWLCMWNMHRNSLRVGKRHCKYSKKREKKVYGDYCGIGWISCIEVYFKCFLSIRGTGGFGEVRFVGLGGRSSLRSNRLFFNAFCASVEYPRLLVWVLAWVSSLFKGVRASLVAFTGEESSINVGRTFSISPLSMADNCMIWVPVSKFVFFRL